MTEKGPNRVWIVSRKKKTGGLTIYGVKSTERKAIDALEALRRDLIDRDGVHPGNIHFSSDDDQDWCLTINDPFFKEGEVIYQADWFAIDDPSAFGE